MYKKEYCLNLYCKDIENVENYEAAKKDNFKGWVCHHRLETHNSDGERRSVDIAYKELIALDMYWHRPAEELIFMLRREHYMLHFKGKPKSEELRRRNSEAHKGKHRSEETKKKISETKKGKKMSEEFRKKMSEALKGRTGSCKGLHWYNNGKINVRCYECPEGFVPGRIPRSGI